MAGIIVSRLLSLDLSGEADRPSTHRRPLNAEAICIYINFFDFTGLRLDLAFR